jgi:hypothetical protein
MPPKGRSMASSLTRVTINLTPAAVAGIRTLTDLTGDSQTDVINRAIRVGAFIEGRQAQGYELILRAPDGPPERVHIL